MKIYNIKFYLALTVSLLITATCYNFWFTKAPLQLSYDIESTKQEQSIFEVYYGGRPSSTYKYSVNNTNSEQATQGKYSFLLDSTRIAKIKIEILAKPSNFRINNFELQGLWTVDLNDLELIAEQNIVDTSITDNSISFTTLDDMAALEFEVSPRVLRSFRFNFLLFSTIFIFSLLINYKFIDYLALIRSKEKAPISSFIFLACFFTIICIPILNINKEENAHNENRKLASYKNLFNNKEINLNFGADFEKWFNDRFFLRNELMSLYDLTTNFFTASIENSAVLPGKEDWLFYKGDNGIANFQNLELFSTEELEKITTYLTAINNWAKNNNKEFYYVIAPDKNKIYGEFYPDKIKQIYQNEKSRTNQLISHLQKHTNIKTIYLYDFMHKNKDKGLLYFKNDTHWNSLGAYYGYENFMNAFFPQSKLLAPNTFNEYKNLAGDITTMGRNIPENQTTYLSPTIDFSHNVTSSNRSDTNIPITTVNPSPLIEKNIFMLRDSFAVALYPYLSSTFKNAEYVWRYNIAYKDLEAIKEKYDIIILEQVERLVPQLIHLSFPEVQ